MAEDADPPARRHPSRRAVIGLAGAGGLGLAAAAVALSPRQAGRSGPFGLVRATWTSVRDHGAKGDGRTDDTAAVQRALAAVPERGGVLYFPAGTYLVQTLYITRSHIAITGDGPGRSRLVRAPGGGIDTRLIAVNSTGQYDTAAPGAMLTDVHVSSLQLDGSNSAVSTATGSSTVVGTLFLGLVRQGSVSGVEVSRPREIGVNLFGCQDVQVSKVTVTGMIGDYQVNSINVAGDHFAGDPGWPVNRYPSSRVTVDSCTVVQNWARPSDSPAGGGFGICVQGATGVRVQHCRVDLSGDPRGSGRYGGGIIFEGGGPAGAALLGRGHVATGNTVRHCAVGIGGVDSNPGPRTTGILEGYSIVGNTISDCTQGIQVSGRSVTVTGNRVSAVSPLVLGTTKPTAEGGYTVARNTFASTGRACIETLKTDPAGSLSTVTIQSNVLDGRGARQADDAFGLVVRGTLSHFAVTDNTIRDTLASAIYFWSVDARAHASSGTVERNTITGVCRSRHLSYPAYYGVVASGSRGITVSRNEISGGAGLQAATASVNGSRVSVSRNTDSRGRPAVDVGSAQH